MASTNRSGDIRTDRYEIDSLRPDSVPTEASSAQPTATPRLIRIDSVPTAGSRLRVAAYCRVSTLMSSQLGSVVSQETHYRNYICANPDWELAGIYVDSGTSGVDTENRTALLQMLSDAADGKIDLILTKSISRFARNTTEFLSMVRALTAYGVGIYFEKERLDSRSDLSEFILSTLAGFAEEESHSISGNLKWGIRKRFQSGTYRASVAPFGYRKEDAALVIDEEEAAVVRRMYESLLSGIGAGSIANDLNADGIYTRRGKLWSYARIRAIVSNPVYIGDSLYQKTYMDDYFRQQSNDGMLDQYYHEANHAPIVDRETFELANASFDFVAKSHRQSSAFAGKTFCAVCGCSMYRRQAKGLTTFVCSAVRKHRMPCGNKPIHERALQHAFLTVLNKLSFSQHLPEHRILDEYRARLTVQQTQRTRLMDLAALLERNREAQSALISHMMASTEVAKLLQKKRDLLAEEQKLLKEKNRLLRSTAQVGALAAFVNRWTQTTNIADFPSDRFPMLVERVEVKTGVCVTFQFSCGLAVTETLEIKEREEP
ncbi:MAG: recombinase family protein [Oscillospiraceae bacterium]|nr:recombinase family protein [Oscillospiraceae bacterium]